MLVHAGLNDFDEEKDLDEYKLVDYLFYRPDYDKRYYQDENMFLVTGHTPTMAIREDGKPFIYTERGHIALDCGRVYGGRLTAYCLNNGKVTYVDKIKE